MRPTWHFVARADIRWMLELTAPRVHRTLSHYLPPAGPRHRHANPRGCRLRASARWTRADPQRARDTSRPRGYRGQRDAARPADHLRGARRRDLQRPASRQGVHVRASRRARAQCQTAASRRGARRADARYFRSHGPATIRDFVWWSGLTTPDAKRGLEINRARSDVDRRLHLLDDRRHATPQRRLAGQSSCCRSTTNISSRTATDDAVPHGPARCHPVPGETVTFQHAVVSAGQVAGTWRMARTSERVSVDVVPLRRLTTAERGQVAEVAERYSRFLGVPVSISM